MLRIVSLLPSATEIVVALGFGEQLVGRSHECDFPEAVKRLPACTAPAFDPHGTSREIDARVKDRLHRALSVYDVDDALLRDLAPDVIITQAQCEVCAVDLKEVERALGAQISAGRAPRLVSLTPNSLSDIWADMRRVAAALGVPERGAALVDALTRRLDEVAARAATQPRRPRVACVEWIDPLMAAGNWLPELVALAHGDNLFGAAGQHSPWLQADALWAADPDVVVIMPCGFDVATARRELPVLTRQSGWRNLRAVRDGKVFVADGNQYFNRPGPRVAESLEILAEMLHPAAFAFGHRGRGFEVFDA